MAGKDGRGWLVNLVRIIFLSLVEHSSCPDANKYWQEESAQLKIRKSSVNLSVASHRLAGLIGFLVRPADVSFASLRFNRYAERLMINLEIRPSILSAQGSSASA